MSGHSHSHGRPKGVASFTELPDRDGLLAAEHVFLPDGLRERLLRRVVFTMRNRGRLAGMRTALQGIILLTGAPGTGKSTTARILVNQAAEQLREVGTSSLVRIDPHSLPSSSLGESQQNVKELLGPVLKEYTSRTDFVFVIIDEVEAFAVRRSTASFETNPVDVHRATDAILEGLDELLFTHANIMVIMTSNFPEAIDDAVLSRVDEVVGFHLPTPEQIADILRDTIEEYARVWPALDTLAGDESGLAGVAKQCEGMSGREVRKLVLSAIVGRDVTVDDPAELTVADLEQALTDATTTPTM